jgi:hypothetical protein
LETSWFVNLAIFPIGANIVKALRIGQQLNANPIFKMGIKKMTHCYQQRDISNQSFNQIEVGACMCKAYATPSF